MGKFIICGFDYETTRKRVDAHIADEREVSVIYLTDNVWRNDSVLCHMIVEYDGVCPYILKGQADVINAKTATDALAYIEWLKYGGKVNIHSQPRRDFGERYSQLEAYKYLSKLAGTGTLYLD